MNLIAKNSRNIGFYHVPVKDDPFSDGECWVKIVPYLPSICAVVNVGKFGKPFENRNEAEDLVEEHKEKYT